jgi:nucleoid DNA-binding protein
VKVLVQHIENLLPEHDCVVVPGLGGFVQNEVQARIQPGARLFYPASKEIGFNHRLKFNDGLLAQSYQESNGMSFEEANAEIQKAVQEIQEKLEAGKFIRLGRTGTLFMIEQQLVFRPDHHNHFYPEAYGLTPYTYPLLKKEVPVQEAVAAPLVAPFAEKEIIPVKAESKSTRDEFIHLRFNRNSVRQLAAGVAVILFIVFFSKPAGKSSDSQEAGMMHNYLSTTIKSAPQDSKTEIQAISTLPDKDSFLTEPTTRAAVPTPTIQKEPVAQVSSSNDAVTSHPQGYYIIVSTFVRKATAQRWINEHEGDTFLNDARILVSDGHARIFVKNCTSSDEASHFLNEFTSSHPEYASAWIYSATND